MTKEELKLKRLYGREIAEDKDYFVHPNRFAVRPVQEPFVQTYVRRVGEDGIEFFAEEHMIDRDPRFYAGRLSAFFHQVNMFESPDTALGNLKALAEHAFPSKTIMVLADSLAHLGELPMRVFHWEIVGGGTSPVGQYQLSLGGSRNVEMLGVIIIAEDAAYLMYLSENNLATLRPRSLQCGDVDRVSPKEASALMGERFRRFLQSVRFSSEL